MKRRTVMFLVLSGFVAGGVTGHFVSSYFWSRVLEDMVVADSLHEVSSAYVPLRFLRRGENSQAVKHLEMTLDLTLRHVEVLSDHLKRPDMLTNSIVVRAKSFPAEGAIESVEPTSALPSAPGSP